MNNKESSLLQKVYLQKSRVFLFPLVGIKNDRVFKPMNTYISSKVLISPEYPKGITVRDNILIVAYPKSYSRGKDKDTWDMFEAEQIVGSPKFMAIHETEEEFIYTMNMASWSADWKCFLHGRYSLFSEKAKNLVITFRRSYLRAAEHRKLYCYLYPYDEQCINDFAEELGIPTQELMEVKELCSKPDMTQENFKCEALKQSLKQDENEDKKTD